MATTLSAMALFMALWTASPAQAARPLATDDAGVLARSSCEAELYVARLNLPESGGETTASTQLSCGLGGNVQAAVGYGRSSQADGDSGSRHDALSVAAKWRLFEAEAGPALALSAGSVMGRTGSGPFQFDSVYVNAAVSGALAENVTGHANLGWARSRSDSSNRTTWNLALEYTLKTGLDAGIEWYGDDRSAPWLGLGMRLAATDKLVLGVSYAVQSSSLRQRLVSLGLTFGF